VGVEFAIRADLHSGFDVAKRTDLDVFADLRARVYRS
jgi:hypothetical protein